LTSIQLEKLDTALNPPGVQTGLLPKLTQEWKTRGTDIKSLTDLLGCYYSDFKIVCVPAAGQSPKLIHDQYVKLRKAIVRASAFSAERRKAAGFLMSSEELECYTRSAFEHFFNDPTTPFNFLDAALRNNPIPATFSDHIAKAAAVLSGTPPPLSGTKALERLAPLVASAIFLDMTRKRLPHRG